MADAQANATPAKPTATAVPGDSCVIRILGWYDSLKGNLGVWRTTWQQIGNYIMPRKSMIIVKRTEGSNAGMEQVYSLAAADAVQVHAGGEMDYLFSGKWFKFSPGREREEPSDEAVRWYEECTEIALDELLRSNFMVEVHEMLLDRVAFGTGTIHCDEGRKSTLNFTNDRLGTFAVMENDEHIVDTLLREVELTAQQAVQMFGLGALNDARKAAKHDARGDKGVPDKIRDAYTSNEPKRRAEKFNFIHAIYPREDSDRDPTMPDGANKPFASCWIEVDSKMLCRESGYDEQPAAVTRYLKWEKEPYGYSPSMLAMPAIKQNNLMERTLTLLMETKAVPRILIPDNLDGNDFDFRAGGQSFYESNKPEAKPQAWLEEGDAKGLAEFIQSKDELIRNLYLYDLWKMLAQIEREMTAYEVQQRLAEKLTGISPSFHRMQPEFFNVILRRVFGVLLRAGKFPPPPQDVLRADPHNPKSAIVAIPEVVLTGKLAMHIKSADTQAFFQWLQQMIPVAEVVGVSALNVADIDAGFRMAGMNGGVPVSCMRSEADVKKLKAQQDAAAQAQQQAQLAQQTAPALAAASKASPQMQQLLAGQAGAGGGGGPAPR